MRRTAVLVLLTPLLLLAAPGHAATADRQPPTGSFTTASGAVRLGAPVRAGGLTDVEGRAADDAAGVARVRVLFCPNGQTGGGGWSCGSSPLPGSLVAGSAELSCTSTARLRCTWKVAAPTAPGRYLAVVQVTDRAGRVGRAGPLDLVVV